MNLREVIERVQRDRKNGWFTTNEDFEQLLAAAKALDCESCHGTGFGFEMLGDCEACADIRKKARSE